ncbi:transposase [Candidatus Rickettsiella viridis]|uniref:Transposase n=1 Tax=Candidatus Rickettsiella viridis TaxID=676208 RepID=A0A2Z5V737_9COXI|nr:Rpn family recombination-promoting nuclease/putative transposase [Candidatus Rickettsiella viridis]BBB15167.1 transposase [Candidatus Rickettsiella viridis]
MTVAIYHPHDKFFKRNLKEKKVAIDFLKVYLPQAIYNAINLDTLQLTEKSFIVPELREIHSDIIYKCEIKQKSGYLFFLIEHESTANDKLMAFRLLHYSVSLSAEHLRQGNKKLPIILPLCIYHGEVSPYPHSIDLYDNFEDPEFARQVAFKPFKLIDLTVLSDEEISQHGLVSLMEMLFKHHRAKNFLSIMRELLKTNLVQNIVKQLDISYLSDMLNYVLITTRDDTEAKADKLLINELIAAFPQRKEVIMTFAEQIEQRGLQKGMQKGMQKGRYGVAKNLLATGMPIELIRQVTELPDLDLTELEKI